MRLLGRRLTLRAITLAAVLLLPLVQAASSSGAVIAAGSVEFSGVSTVTFHDSAVFIGDASHVTRLHAESSPGSTAEVCDREWNTVEIAGPSGQQIFGTQSSPNREACFPQSGLTVDLAEGDQSGWTALHIRNGGWAEFVPSDGLTVEPRSIATLASRDADGASTRTTGREPVDRPFFLETVVAPSVLATQGGRLIYHCPCEWKIEGPDVIVASSTNKTTYATEDNSTAGPLQQRHIRWLVVTMDAGEVVIESDAALFEILGSSGAAAWNGAARFTAASGNLSVASATYHAAPGDPAVIEGAMQADLTPLAAGDQANLRLLLQGDARAVTLGSVRIAPGPVAGEVGIPWVPIALGAVVATGAALAFSVRAVLKRRGHPVPRSRLARVVAPIKARRAAIHEATADQHAEEGRWAEAHRRYVLAERADPAQAGRFAIEQGVALYAQGKLRDAGLTFLRAAKLTQDGVAEKWAARCFVQMGDFEHAAAVLVAALAKPDLSWDTLAQISSGPEFAEIMARPDITRALDAALARIGIRP